MEEKMVTKIIYKTIIIISILMFIIEINFLGARIEWLLGNVFFGLVAAILHIEKDY